MNFSKIIKTNIELNQFEHFNDLFSQLPKYDEDENKSGFSDYGENIVVDQLFEKDDFSVIKNVVLDQSSEKDGFSVIKDISPRIIKKRFFLKKDDSLLTADVFWIFHYNLFLIRGSEDMAKKVMKALHLIFKGLTLEEIEIDNDFLMWIASQYSTDKGKLSKDLFIDQIDQGGTIKSGKSLLKSRVNEMTLKKGHKTDLSLPAIYGLVNDHIFSLIGGDFAFEKTTINLKLTTKNTIYAYSTLKDLKDITLEERYGLLFPMINEIVNVIHFWESLDDEFRYPDESYMKAMSESFEEQVVECRENLKKLRTKYAEKRKKVS